MPLVRSLPVYLANKPMRSVDFEPDFILVDFDSIFAQVLVANFRYRQHKLVVLLLFHGDLLTEKHNIFNIFLCKALDIFKPLI